MDSSPEKSTGSLRILLLGPPAVYLDDQPYPIQRRLLRSILFYLAAQARPVNRAELINVFWPDEGEEDSRAKLRVALSKLRTELPSPHLLKTHLDQVSLDFERIYVDSQEFEALYQESQRALQMHSGTPLPEATYQQLIKATRLWRSPRFMAGANLTSTSELDNWLVTLAQSYEYALLNILTHLVDHLTLIGDINEALQIMLQVAEMEPFNEDHHLRILGWLHDLGRRAELLKYYEKACRSYEKDGTPVPAGLMEYGQGLQAEPAGLLSPEQVIWSSAASLQVPFVGRRTPLKQLQAAFLRGGAIIVTGEAGAGKSRLISELYQSLTPVPRLMLAIGRAHESNLPFQPLVDLLRNAILVDEWSRLDPVWASTLQELLPELPSLLPGLKKPSGAPLQRNTLYEALRELLLVAARRRRVLFFLDDAQWCDEATLEALSYLLERDFFKQHGLLVIAARIEQTPEALETYFSRPRHAAFIEKIELDPLSYDDIREIAHFAMNHTPSEALVRKLQLDTGGNALYVLETLRAVLDLSRTSSQEQWAERLPLASSIHALARDRLRILSQQATQVLVTAAVIGREFPIDILRAATQLESDALVAVLEELENSHLISPLKNSRSDGDFAFIHNKIREVLLLELSEARKRMLHQRVANAIEKRGGSLQSQARELAQHYEIAGDPAAAISYWLLHARSATAGMDRAAASNAYQRAESLLFRIDRDLSDEEIYRLYRGWANLSQDTEDLDGMERSYAAMLRLGEERRSSLLLGSGNSGLAYVQVLRARPAKAVAQLERALPYIRQSYHLTEQIDALNRMAQCQMKLQQMDAAENSLLQALETSQLAVDESAWEARISTNILLGRYYNQTGHPRRAYEYAQQALSHAYRLQRSMPGACARMVLAEAYQALGRYEEALETCQPAVEVSTSMAAWQNLASLQLIQARACGSLGRLDEAWGLAQNALQLARQNNASSLAAQAHSVLGDLLRVVGDTPAAIEQYRLGISEAVEPVALMENQYRLGLALAFNGQPQTGVGLVNQVVAFALENGSGHLALVAQINLAVLLFLRGEVQPGLAQAQSVAGPAEERGLISVSLWDTWLSGMAALQQGDAAAASAYAEQLTQTARLIHMPWTELYGLELAHRAAGLAGKSADHYQAQIEQILAQMQARCRSADLRTRLEHYTRTLLASIA